jgi:hypothetical protein
MASQGAARHLNILKRVFFTLLATQKLNKLVTENTNQWYRYTNSPSVLL